MPAPRGRPTASAFIGNIIEDFCELHGDRLYGDDRAVIGGVGRLGGMPVTVIGLEKGGNTRERVARNFGSAHPEGYRKALRLMHQAEKFSRPVVCFVDTSGAYSGIGAEERGQGSAIAHNLVEMMALKTPILSILIGEGGSAAVRWRWPSRTRCGCFKTPFTPSFPGRRFQYHLEGRRTRRGSREFL